jgi:hypothetical protein
MYVYIQTEPRLWTVGFFDPDSKWRTDSDHSDRERAARRVAYLNGTTMPDDNKDDMIHPISHCAFCEHDPAACNDGGKCRLR